MKVYLAGGFRTYWHKEIEDSFSETDSVIFFNPSVHKLKNSDHYYFWDTLHLEKCDVVFANLENSNPLALGLIFEMGYAKGLNKKVILVDQKSVNDIEYAKQFRLVRESADIVFDKLEDGILFLKSFIM